MTETPGVAKNVQNCCDYVMLQQGIKSFGPDAIGETRIILCIPLNLSPERMIFSPIR
jgi:hypothetical protein